MVQPSHLPKPATAPRGSIYPRSPDATTRVKSREPIEVLDRHTNKGQKDHKSAR